MVILVWVDDEYGLITWKMDLELGENMDTSFGNPDFVRYAESYGARGSRVTELAALVPTLERAFGEGGVHVVEVPIDYSENMRVLVEELQARGKGQEPGRLPEARR